MLLYSYCNGFKNNNFWGFILTMWYVNKVTAMYISVNFDSFILTMWYVNHCPYQINSYPLPSFYINYVVCK